MEVRHAIQPVAERMPGHMNVLFAEADVPPYEHLKELDEINGEFSRADVALVISANDVPPPRHGRTRPRRSTACRSWTSTRPSPSSH